MAEKATSFLFLFLFLGRGDRGYQKQSMLRLFRNTMTATNMTGIVSEVLIMPSGQQSGAAKMNCEACEEEHAGEGPKQSRVSA
jgi:hypothetical protein